jgi:hypothetical protein
MVYREYANGGLVASPAGIDAILDALSHQTPTMGQEVIAPLALAGVSG